MFHVQAGPNYNQPSFPGRVILRSSQKLFNYSKHVQLVTLKVFWCGLRSL